MTSPKDTGRAAFPHKWIWCRTCDRYAVVCGKCGNNTCNGGYGELPDGSKCDACPSAYALDDADAMLAERNKG